MDVFDHIETEARRHWASQTDAFVIDTDCLRQRLETRYTLVVAPGNSQCRLYLMPYPMRPGQHPMHLEQRFQDVRGEHFMLPSGVFTLLNRFEAGEMPPELPFEIDAEALAPAA